MNTASENKATSNEKAASNDATFSQLLPAWEQALAAYKVQGIKVIELLSAELKLSFSAITLHWLSGLFIVFFASFIWLTANITIAYAMYLVLEHWLIVPFCLILLNILGLLIALFYYKKSAHCIGLKHTKQALFEN